MRFFLWVEYQAAQSMIGLGFEEVLTLIGCVLLGNGHKFRYLRGDVIRMEEGACHLGGSFLKF